MNDYKLWIKNALEQANQDDSWHLVAKHKTNGVVQLVILLIGILGLLAICMINATV